MDTYSTTASPSTDMSPAAVKGSLQAIAAMVAFLGVVAIIALVLGAMAYSVTSVRTSRRDLFFYTLSQNPIRLPGGGGTGAVLYSKTLNTVVAAGQRVILTSIALNTELVGSNPPPNNQALSLVTSVSIPTSVALNATVEGRGTVEFVGYQSSVVVTSSVPSVDNVLRFTYGDIANGQSNTVTLVNTGAVPLLVSQIRILAGAV